jgi:hypothetical protein
VVLDGAGAGASSDLYANVGPGVSLSGLADRYPLGHYALDQHFSAVTASLTGGIDASGVPSLIAFFLANLLWQITAFCANALITLFGLAFSLDLLNGSDATAGAGTLAPISDAIAGVYAHTFGQPWMVVAVTATGCWAMWHALVQRRYTETAGALGKSLVFCLIALAIVTRPDATIGQASRLTNQLSGAMLSVTAHGELTGAEQARRAGADQLFALLVYTPWVALEFAGTEHCTRIGTGSADHDPESVAVRPLSPDPAQDARMRHQLQATGHVTASGKECVSNSARYPEHFLRYPPGSSDRDAEYEALNDADPAKLPDSDPAKHSGSYQPGVVDKPVTDAMEKGGQDQRLLLAVVIAIGELGALLLLGSLAVSVVLAQVVVLVLACFSPVALVVAIVPGRGHDAFRAWAARLAGYLLQKAVYSLILAVVLAVLSALQDATSNLGWLMSFGLQALLLWTVYLQRHNLTAHLAGTLHHHARSQPPRLPRPHHGSHPSAGAAHRRPHSTPTHGGAQPAAEHDAPAPTPHRASNDDAPVAIGGGTGAPDELAIDRDRDAHRHARTATTQQRLQREQQRRRGMRAAHAAGQRARASLHASTPADPTPAKHSTPERDRRERPQALDARSAHGSAERSGRTARVPKPPADAHVGSELTASAEPPRRPNVGSDQSLADEVYADRPSREDLGARADQKGTADRSPSAGEEGMAAT